MKRYRWFAVGLSTSLQQFVNRLRLSPMADERDFGFIPMAAQDEHDRLRFRYLRRSSIQVMVLDMEGNARQQKVETIDGIDFEVFENSGRKWLRIDDPPRSLRDFMNSLEDTAGFGFSADPVTFSLDVQKAALANLDATKLVGFKGLGSSAQHKLITRLDVVSKEGLEPDRLEFLKGLDFKMDQTTFEVAYQMLKGQLTFASSGVVRATGALTPYLVACVERELSSVASQ